MTCPQWSGVLLLGSKSLPRPTPSQKNLSTFQEPFLKGFPALGQSPVSYVIHQVIGQCF